LDCLSERPKVSSPTYPSLITVLTSSRAQKELSLSPPFSLEGDTALEFALLLVLHRITQRWNQTGQKFAGAADIVHNFWMPHPVLLWGVVAVTYLTISFRMKDHLINFLKVGTFVGTLCSSMLCVSAFAFKLGFTASDAPELLFWLGEDVVDSLQTIPLVGSARIVFLLMGLGFAWASGSRWYSKANRVSKKGQKSIIDYKNSSTNS
jgi:ethanolaminephosphotransferase